MTLNKRGFVSLFFLSWFLIISAWVSLGYLQLRAEMDVAQQLQLSEQQDLRLIPIFRWVRCQLQQQYRCDGWRPEIQADVAWSQGAVEIRTEFEKIAFRLDETDRKVTNYEIEMR